MSALLKNRFSWLLGLLLAPVALDSVALVPVAVADSQAPTESELSVPPLDHVEYPDDRPQWVDDADASKPYTRVADHKLVVVSGLYESPDQARDHARLLARVAAEQYAFDLLNFQTELSLDDLEIIRIDDLISRQYQGTATQGDSEVHEHALELTITPETQRTIRTAAKNIEVGRRLHHLGSWAVFGLLALLGSSAVVGTVNRFGCRKPT